MNRIIFDNTVHSVLILLISLIAGAFSGLLIYMAGRKIRMLKNVRIGILLTLISIGMHIGRRYLNADTLLFHNIIKLNGILYIIAFSVLIAEIMIIMTKRILNMKRFARKDTMSEQIEILFTRLIVALILLVSLSMILNLLGINVLSVVTGLGIGGLAVALAAQDFLANIIGGITIFSSKIIQIGDYVSIDNNEGTVVYIGLRTTKIRMLNDRKVIIPNKVIMESTIVNHSYGNRNLLNYIIGVTYDTSYKKVLMAVEIIKDILHNDERIPSKNDIEVGFFRFDTYSLNIYVNFYVKKNSDIRGIKQDFHFALKERFDKEGIEIAFPTSTIFLQQRSVNNERGIKEN